jgi:hypothetical protein
VAEAIRTALKDEDVVATLDHRDLSKSVIER